MNFGRYEVLGTLGEGGFATVYRAWDPAAGRLVAVKALFPQLAANPEARARFLAEVNAISLLRHPNTVEFLDAGETAAGPYLVMELIEGETLSQLLTRGERFSTERVAAIMRGLGSALDFVHAAGMVHRDVTARNVMLDKRDRVVLMDFGIVRALDNASFTRTGGYLGTAEYTAPELVRGAQPGPSADIYALGVLAYQLLSGHLPFTGAFAHVLYAHAHLPPPDLAELAPEVPPHAVSAVMRALAKEPPQRPATAGDFARALSAPAASPPQPAPPPLTDAVLPEDSEHLVGLDGTGNLTPRFPAPDRRDRGLCRRCHHRHDDDPFCPQPWLRRGGWRWRRLCRGRCQLDRGQWP